jgi:hypothetical protein
LDAALSAAARRRRLRPVWHRPLLVAAAAAVLLALPVAWTLSRAALAREDFDGDGRVLVLDAYRLSLALQRGERVARRRPDRQARGQRARVTR